MILRIDWEGLLMEPVPLRRWKASLPFSEELSAENATKAFVGGTWNFRQKVFICYETERWDHCFEWKLRH